MSARLFALVPEQVPEVHALASAFRSLLASPRGRMAAFARIGDECCMPAKTVAKKFYAFKQHGADALVDRRKCAALWAGGAGLSAADVELVKLYVENNQRKAKPGIRALLRDYRAGRVETATPLNPATGYPLGWSGRNLMRYAPSEYELKAARIGRSAAAAHRPLVYTTRANLYPGQYYLFDDMWHDHEVVDLDQKRRGRPLEFHALDLASACKFAWGNRTRVLRDDGTHEGLKGGDFNFLLAAVMGGTGYSQRGTTLLAELGTAAIDDVLEGIISDATGGLVTVDRNGMDGAAAHAGQYAGRRKGNFRFKAALESLGNLIHNELACLPGQTGMDRWHAPEEQHGRQRHADALLAALSQIPEERAQWLQWPYCTIQQFRLIAEEVYARINRRTEHDLEGWDERYTPDGRTGKMRRLSPWEVWTPGRRGLQPLEDSALALIIGHEQGVERLTRNGLIELRDGEVSGDVLRFDATMLPDREKFLTVLNPYDATRLYAFDARGAFVGTLARVQSVCRSDAEAVQREMGRAAKQEAALLAPLRQRHMKQAREKAAMHAHNAEILGGGERALAAARQEQQARRFGAALLAAEEPVAADATEAAAEATEDHLDDTPTNNPNAEIW